MLLCLLDAIIWLLHYFTTCMLCMHVDSMHVVHACRQYACCACMLTVCMLCMHVDRLCMHVDSMHVVHACWQVVHACWQVVPAFWQVVHAWWHSVNAGRHSHVVDWICARCTLCPLNLTQITPHNVSLPTSPAASLLSVVAFWPSTTRELFSSKMTVLWSYATAVFPGQVGSLLVFDNNRRYSTLLGKSTSLRVALSLYGVDEMHFLGGRSTPPSLMQLATMTTLPIGVDDIQSAAVLEDVAVKFYNGAAHSTCSSKDTRAQTSLIVTGNGDFAGSQRLDKSNLQCMPTYRLWINQTMIYRPHIH